MQKDSTAAAFKAAEDYVGALPFLLRMFVPSPVSFGAPGSMAGGLAYLKPQGSQGLGKFIEGSTDWASKKLGLPIGLKSRAEKTAGELYEQAGFAPEDHKNLATLPLDYVAKEMAKTLKITPPANLLEELKGWLPKTAEDHALAVSFIRDKLNALSDMFPKGTPLKVVPEATSKAGGSTALDELIKAGASMKRIQEIVPGTSPEDIQTAMKVIYGLTD
mgnify:CR=1 FL=1